MQIVMRTPAAIWPRRGNENVIGLKIEFEWFVPKIFIEAMPQVSISAFPALRLRVQALYIGREVTGVRSVILRDIQKSAYLHSRALDQEFGLLPFPIRLAATGCQSQTGNDD